MSSKNKSINLLSYSILGVLLVTCWLLIVVPILKNDSAAFENIREYIGNDTYANNIGDELSEPVISKDFLEYKIVNKNGNILEIESSYITSDIVTNKKIYENYNTYFVDSTTRKHVNNDQLYFIFPTNVQKQSYQLLDPNMEVPATFVFEGTKYIDDLEVYVFSCENIGADFSNAWPEFAPKTVFADQSCKTSIEPVTGKTVQFSINWDMYVVEDGTHKSVELGRSKTTEFTERILLQSAKGTKQLFYIYDFVIPVFLILFYIAIFFVILYNNKSKEKGKIIIRQLEELHKTEKLKTIGQLASRLSHDIRNPLTVIKTSITLLERSDADIEKKYSRLFVAINKAILRIEHQVNNVLDFIQHRPLKLEETHLDTIIDSALESLNIPKNIQIEKITTDAKIICDQHMIMIVFINIIGNAMHAIGSNEGKVRIQVDDNIANDLLKITISNNGEDIHDDILPKIFEPLFTTKQEGTGLGLASCKSIIEQHGGTISVKNNPTTFTIILPKNFKN
jgi:signal transduction histidine kinase